MGIKSTNRGYVVTSGENPPRPDFNEASAQLDEGLKTCRAVMNNYRAMLTGGGPVGLPDASNDEEPLDQPPDKSEEAGL